MDPQAALFFVPVMVMQMAGNLWHPYKFLESIVHHVRKRPGNPPGQACPKSTICTLTR